MDIRIHQAIKDWRLRTANKEDLPVFRILTNQAIQEIAEKLPANKEGLLEIKGIKEKKFQKYGNDILEIVHDLTNSPIEEDEHLSISSYLNLINLKLEQEKVSIKGEISSINFHPRYIFFTLKDSIDESILNCFIWADQYEMFGVELKEGLEIITYGNSKIHKPTGRLTFYSESIELAGEGALKKAYDELKNKLEQKGFFDEKNKKPLPTFPKKIGLITSRTGAVISDFLNNLSQHGFQISHFHSNVEGQFAVPNLLKAINHFKTKDIDILVIIRGGGSMESLQAFNNENLVTEIFTFPKPVICGIGHDQDIPLASLTADVHVSTPTAAANLLNHNFLVANEKLNNYQNLLLNKFNDFLIFQKNNLNFSLNKITKYLDSLSKFFYTKKEKISEIIQKNISKIQQEKNKLNFQKKILIQKLEKNFLDLNRKIFDSEKTISLNNPNRNLKLGYSISFKENKVVKSIKNLNENEELKIKFQDGNISTKIISINN